MQFATAISLIDPVRAGLVSNAEDYVYSSARNYAELDFIIGIELLDLPVITVRK